MYLSDPWRGVFNAIDPDSIYLIQELRQSGEPVRIRRVKADQSASDLHECEIAMSAEHLRVRRMRGTDMRTLIVELAHAHGDVPMGFLGSDIKKQIPDPGV